MRNWEGWLVTALEIAAVIGVLGLVLRWCEASGWQWDLTPDARYTLPPEARVLMRSLPEPVRLIAFVRSGIHDPTGLSVWLPQLAQQSGRIEIEFLDVDREPTRARRYGIQSAPAVVVESARRQRIVYQPHLAVLLSHIAAAVRSTTPRLRVFSNRTPPDQDYARMYAALQSEGFAVEWASGALGTTPTSDTANLQRAGMHREGGADPGVPQLTPTTQGDTPVAEDPARSRSIDVVFAPSDSDLETLQVTLRAGGAVLIATEPSTCREAPRLCTWLRLEAGVEVGTEPLIDHRTRLVAGDPYTILATGLAADHPITAALSEPVLVSQATTVRLTDEVASPGWILLSAAPSARLEGSTGGPTESAVGSKALHPVAVARVTASRGRLVVVGDADFATDRFIEYVGNRNFLLNAANWLAEEHTWLGPRIAPMVTGVQVFFLSAAQAERLLWAFAVGEPAVLAAIGLLVWWRRRR